MNYKHMMLLAMLGFAVSACDSDSKCDDFARRCNADASAIISCVDGKNIEVSCNSDEVCALVNDVPACVANYKEPAECIPGNNVCHNSGLVRVCLDSGKYAYKSCGLGSRCDKGQCIGNSIGGLSGYVRRQCSADHKNVEWVDNKGTVTSIPCREETGFDSLCKEFDDGLAGCVLPDQCNDDFTPYGKCIPGDQRIFCDTRFINPKPSIESCAAKNQICVQENGAAACSSACSKPDDNAFSCTSSDDIEFISRCRNSSSGAYIQSAQAICVSDETSVACVNGAVVNTTCKTDEKCISELGVCSPACSADKLGNFTCNENGYLLQCQKVVDKYVYVSVGKQECDGDMHYYCSADGNGGVMLKSNDCREANYNGETVRAVCLSDIQGIPDYDTCYYDGDPVVDCGSLTDDGVCDGNTLRYCNSGYKTVIEKDCSENKLTCTVFNNVAECSKECSPLTAPSCKYDSDYGVYAISACVPAENNKNYTVTGESFCVGNILYSCDKTGNALLRDCTLNGGICDVNKCRYPACSIKENNVCLADNAIFTCQIDKDGNVLGASLETIACDLDGTCYSCQNGQLKKNN